MATQELYETTYESERHFSFGENWQSFLASVTEERIKIAEDSLKEFMGGKEKIKGKSFVDIGCGSGVFSLAAHRLGVARVVSVDVDESSIACTKILRDRADNPKNWEIKTGSALDKKFIERLGTFDVVYAWGVLHHTGKMFEALKNVSGLVKPNGKMYVAIYNENQTHRTHGTSQFWLKVKRRYNHSSAVTKKLYFGMYATYLCLGLLLAGKNPFAYIRNYKFTRAMSWKHDVTDWLGGYPYEFATPEQVSAAMTKLGFVCQKTALSRSIGCNEYLFAKRDAKPKPMETTVLISVYNNGDCLAKSFQSIQKQTVPVKVICINDASTDETPLVLLEWQKKLGSQLQVITNPKNLGLTKSLNKGLKAVQTPFTARLDADDWWDPKKIEYQLQFLKSHQEYGLVGSWYTNYGHKRKSTVRPPVTDEAIKNSIIARNPFAHSCIVFKTDLVRKLGGYDEQVRYGQDYDLWLRCLNKTKFYNIPKILCHRRVTSGLSIDKQREQMRQALRTRYRYIRHHHLPLRTYIYLIEPFIISITPRALADFKRALRG